MQIKFFAVFAGFPRGIDPRGQGKSICGLKANHTANLFKLCGAVKNMIDIQPGGDKNTSILVNYFWIAHDPFYTLTYFLTSYDPNDTHKLPTHQIWL